MCYTYICKIIGGGFMYQIGDKIFYPMHGAGIIEAIEDKEILGKKQKYYIINITLKNIKVMIPIDKTEQLIIREVVEPEILENVLHLMRTKEIDPNTNSYQQRQRTNTEKIKSGDIYEEARVICELTSLSKTKKLGMGDKMMLNNARQMLISELMLVKEIPEETAEKLLDETHHLN